MHELVSYDSDIFLKLLIHLGVLRFITLFTVVSFVVFVGAVYWVGDILTKPSQVETGSPPTDLGGRTLTFRSGTGTILSGWFFPGISGRGAILLLHPIRSNKREMLPRARFLIHEGFSVLLVDLQAHGESSGERITFGYREAKDIEAAIKKLKDLAESFGAVMPFFDLQDGFIICPELEDYRAHLSDQRKKQSQGGKRGSTITNSNRHTKTKDITSTSRLPRQGSNESLVQSSTEKLSQTQSIKKEVVPINDPWVKEYEATEALESDFSRISERLNNIDNT